MCPALAIVMRRLPQDRAKNSARSRATKGSSVLGTTTERNGNFCNGMGSNPVDPGRYVDASTSLRATKMAAATRLSPSACFKE